MKFRTEITLKDSPKMLSPESLVLLMGSCFSDNMGARLKYVGWPSVVNPCGVLYNPVSIAVLFRLALIHRSIRRDIIASSITMRDGGYVSWFMGSKAMGLTAEDCVNSVSECLDILEEALERAKAVVVTFGTSDVWLLAGTDRAVGNCHKHPQIEFEKRRLTVEETAAAWKEIINAVRDRNPGVNFILTVSPRRYLSEGFADNSRQKAVLILACEILSRIEGVYYFPAYEIINDDLRDYRFYSADLLHPSEQAVDYIWEKFTEFCLPVSDIGKLKEMEREARRKNHRPLVQ